MQKHLAVHNPENISSSKIRTIRDVLTGDAPTLGQLKKVYGKDWIIAYVSAWLIHLNENTNVKNKMTSGQMDFTAERIYETYSLKISDLTLFFRNVKEGVYGALYENLSQEKIMQWISKYFDERCEMAQMVSYTKHDEFSVMVDKIDPKVLKEMFKGVGTERYEHEVKEKNGLGTRFKKKIKMDNNYKEFCESLALQSKQASDKELTERIESWSKRNDLKIYVPILEKELESRTVKP